MDKKLERLGSLNFVWQPVRKENSEFKPVVDLERDELCHSIPVQDTLYENLRTTKPGYGLVTLTIICYIEK